MANMKDLKGFEQHSYNSLSQRLNYLVSRTTLTHWIEQGVIKPSLVTKKNRSTHLLFPTKKLDQLLGLLERARDERLERLEPDPKRRAGMRQTGFLNAKKTYELNRLRRQRGKAEVRQPQPALSDDDASGRMRMTNAKQVQRLFSGYGLYR